MNDDSEIHPCQHDWEIRRTKDGGFIYIGSSRPAHPTSLLSLEPPQRPPRPVVYSPPRLPLGVRRSRRLQ